MKADWMVFEILSRFLLKKRFLDFIYLASEFFFQISQNLSEIEFGGGTKCEQDYFYTSRIFSIDLFFCTFTVNQILQSFL